MTAIRILLVIAALALVGFMVDGIRKSRMRIEDSLFWIVLAVIILVLSLVPQVAGWFSEILGFQSPINFLYLFFIAVLIVKCFTMSGHISQLETKIKELTQQIAVERLNHYERQGPKGCRESEGRSESDQF